MKLSKKTILIGISTLAVVGAGLAYYFITKDKSDVLGWMSSSWLYRKSVAVENSGATLTNEDVLITLDTAALVTAEKLQTDCSDFRFSDSDGTTSLDYWIEDGCNTTSTKIWVRIPSLTAGGKTIYMYYGNNSVSSGALPWGGNVYMYADTTCPTGWTRASDLDGKFLYGSDTYGTNGGSDSHSQGDATCTSTSISTSTLSGSTTGSLTGTTSTHTHSNLKATLLSTTIIPPYTSMITCYKNSFLIAQGLISMFDTSTPTGYTRTSALDDTFIRSNNTYGSTGGSSSHTHTTSTGHITDTTSSTSSLAPLFSATGGTITSSGGYTIHTFTSGGTFTVTGSANVEVLVVGGGGNGGTTNSDCLGGGGGGAGGLLYNSSFAVTAQAYPITIGGAGGNSVFSTLTAIGGGAGANIFAGGGGYNGGSGGGSMGSNKTPGSGTAGQGYSGGYGYGSYGFTCTSGGGGGGSSAAGNSATAYATPGTGGAGTSYNISGTSVVYATGGTGGASTGGGTSTSGAANTGNGGNGANGRSGINGSGGSGIVIIRYLTSQSGSGVFASSTHTHTSTSATASSASNIPPYLDMVFAKADTNTYVDENNVVITSALPPLGWNRFTALDSRFPRGADTYGATGGNATHTHSVSISTGIPSATIEGAGTGSTYADSTHTHSCTTTSDSSSSLPAYTTVIYAQRKVSLLTTIGAEELENHPPSALSLLTEGEVNPTAITDMTPEFSAIFSDSDSTSDTGTYYQIQVNTSSDFTGTTMWDSTQTAISPELSSGIRSQDISYNGTALSEGTTYYWRMKFWDNNSYANEGNWSIAEFTTYINEWRSPDLPYRRSIAVGNTSGGTLTNEDVLITIDTAALVATEKLQTDCDDIRFTDSDGSSALEYWVEGGCNTNSTKIWVRIPTLLSDGKTIYMYYGSSTLENGEETWNGNIYMYADATCPTGWTRASSLDDTFLFGSTTFGTTGGSNSHSQGDAICTSSSINTTNVGGTITGGLSSTSTSHTHSSLKATLLSTSNVLPPYTGAVLCYNNSFLFSQGLISMFDTSTTTGYTRVSALDDTFVRASSSYGTTGGSSTHTHSTTTGYTTGAPGETQTLLTNFSATGGTITTNGAYTIHTFTSSGTFAVQGSGTVDVLVVGGGVTPTTTTGGAAGQVTYNSAYSVSAGNMSVTVGGAGANSVFGVITATGGGGAAGGAGGNGGSRRYGLPGADGTISPIDGLYYGGGGGGGACCDGGAYWGGAGGNRGGGTGGGIGYSGDPGGKWFGYPGSPATANTGGGGGAGGCGSDWGQAAGGAGGSGIVIIRYITQASAGDFASGTHTHPSSSATTASSSNIPSYLDLVFAKTDNETYVTNDNILITSEIPPLGWNRYTPLDSKFPRAASTPGGTGGSATHTHNVDITTGGPSATINGTGSGTNFADSSHTHSCTATSNSASNLPAYTNVIYIQRKDSQITTIEAEDEENHEPNAPTELQTESITNNPKVIDSTPEFSAVFTDGGTSDTGNYYQVQVNTASDFTGTTMWDSTKIAFPTPIAKNARSSDISYAGSTLVEGETYYWRIKFWDNNLYANESDWSATSFFVMTGIPEIATSLQTNGLVNPTQLTRVPPNFTAVYTDPNGDNASAYQIQVNTNSLFTGTIMWDSGKLATTQVSGSRTSSLTYAGIPLTNSGNTLYWRIKFWDIDDTTNNWSTTAQFIDAFSSTYYEGLKLNGLKLD